MSGTFVDSAPSGPSPLAPTGSGSGAAGPERPSSGFGPLLLRLHFYAGLLVAPFLIMAALTGLAYAVSSQLDEMVYDRELRAEAAGRTARPVSEQLAAARAAHPGGTLATVTLGGERATTQVTFDVPGLGEKQRTVYVDPYTAEVRGELITWSGNPPIRTWVDDLHRNLHLGEVGRHYSELAASWLWVVALGGLALWWRRQRGGRGRLRRLLLPDLAAGKGVRRTRGWHASVGVWLVVGLLFLSATGLTWSRYAGANFTAGLDALGARTPQLSTALDGASGPAAASGHHGGAATGTRPEAESAVIDEVVRIARADGLAGLLVVTPPVDARSAWTVAERDDVWPVRRDRVAVDPAAGTVVARSDFADWPWLAKLSRYGINAHMGILFGPVNRILLAALALGLLCVIVWGYRMWWQRRPTRADRRSIVAAPPVHRGAWWGLPPWAILIGLPAVFLLGWALPLFGLTLLVFIVVDIALAKLRRGAARTR